MASRGSREALISLLNNLPFDSYITELRKKLQCASKPAFLQCSICSLPDPSRLVNCSTCRRLFCEPCSKNVVGHHCKPGTSLAVPITVDADADILAIAAQFGVDQCPVHQKAREYYCEVCQVPLCGGCLLNKQAPHAGHDLLDRATLVTRCNEIDTVLDFANTVESHQSISAKICLDELVKLKSDTERNAVIWLAFAEKLTTFVDSFVRNRVSGYARAKAQHLLAQGAAAADSSASNRRLINYLTSIKGTEPENIDGILAHNVLTKLKTVVDDPSVIAGYSDGKAADQVPNESEDFDYAMEQFKTAMENLATKLSISEESTMPEILAATISLKPLASASSEDLDHNKEYVFTEALHSLEQLNEDRENFEAGTESVGDDVSSIISSASIHKKKTHSIPIQSDARSESSLGDKASDKSAKLRDYLPQLKLETGDLVLVSSLKNPTDFHVTKLRLSNTFQRINQDAMSFGKTPERRPIHFDIGMPILACYKENRRWYRARVINIRLVGDVKEFQVYYVDFGNKEWVAENVGRLHSICSSLLQHTPQAIHCSLYNIVPNSTDGVWSSKACEELEKMFGSLSATVCVCKDPSSQGIINAPWQIDLYRNSLSAKTAPESFRDALIFLGYGCFATEYSSAPMGAPGKDMAVSNSGAQPPPSVGRPDGSLRAFRSRPALVLNEVYQVALAHADNPWSFYCHILDEQTNSLTELNRGMDQYAKVQLKASNHYTPALRAGLPVVAPYADGRYYRAVVLRRVEGTPVQVVVRFVDYGNEASITTTSLIDIPDEFLKLPTQAIKCRLHAVKPVNGTDAWAPEATPFLLNHLKPGEFYDMLVIGAAARSGQPNVVELFEDTENGSAKKSLADALISAGFAVPDTSSLGDYSPLTSTSNTELFLEPAKRPASPQRNEPLSFPKFIPPVTSEPQVVAPTHSIPAITLKHHFSSNNCDDLLPTENDPRPVLEPEPKTVQVTLTHVTNPYDFHVRPVRLNALVERLEHALKVVVDANLATNVAAAANGEMVCVCDDTGVWKRGRVASLSTVTDVNSIVDIFLIDYGSYVGSPLSNLCRISDVEETSIVQSLFNLPPTTFNCALDGVKPAGLGGSVWSRKASELFIDLLGIGSSDSDNSNNSDKPLEAWAFTSGVRFTEGKAKGRIPVRLLVKNVIPATAFTLEGRKFVSLASQLIDKGVALSDIPLISANAVQSELSQRSEETFQYSIPASVASVVSTPLMMLTVDKLTGRAEIARVTSSSSLSPTSLAPTESKKVASGDVFFPRKDLFTSSSPAPVKIKQAILHSINAKDAIFHFVDREVMDDLAVKCQILADDLMPPTDASELIPGTFVLAVDCLRGWWSRGVIKSHILKPGSPSLNETDDIIDSPEFVIYFVDLGYSGKIDMHNLRVLPKSAESDELALRPCAHYPIIFPELTLSASFLNMHIPFVDQVQEFIFSLKLFAILRDGIAETSHEGISAYLGSAFVRYHPENPSQQTPSYATELGEFLCRNSLAFRESSPKKMCIAYPPPFFKSSDKGPSPVLISHINAPDQVWLQRKTDDTERAILRMRARIIETADNLPPIKEEFILPWMPLIVCWPIDNGWYRAVCVSLSNHIVHVYFVDYGNDDHVPVSCCKMMPANLHRSLPPFAVPSRISPKCLSQMKKTSLEKLLNICCHARAINDSGSDDFVVELFQPDPNLPEKFVALK